MKIRWIRARLLLLLSTFMMSDQTRHDTTRRFLYKWKTAEFDYPNKEARNAAIYSGALIPNNVIILDADYHGIVPIVYSLSAEEGF